jgi:hypothetical protein
MNLRNKIAEMCDGCMYRKERFGCTAYKPEISASRGAIICRSYEVKGGGKT